MTVCDHAGSGEKKKTSVWLHGTHFSETHLSFSFLFCFSPSVAHILGAICLSPTLRNRKHLSQCEMWPYRIHAEVERVVEEFGGVKKWLQKKKNTSATKGGINHSEMIMFTGEDCLWLTGALKCGKNVGDTVHCQDKQRLVNQICHATQRHDLYLQFFLLRDLHFRSKAESS